MPDTELLAIEFPRDVVIPPVVTTGQVITAAHMNQVRKALDDLWIDLQALNAASLTDPTTTAGDLLVRGPAALNALPVGSTNGLVLMADLAQPVKMKWGTVDAASIGAVPTTRQVIAGAGMSGGGPLSADVTLNANVTSVFGRTGDVVLTAAEIAGIQTPWLTDINGNQMTLYNALEVQLENANPTQACKMELFSDAGRRASFELHGSAYAAAPNEAWLSISGVFRITAGGSYMMTFKDNKVGVMLSTDPQYTLDVMGDCNITGTYRVNGVPIGTGGGGMTDPTTTLGDLIVRGATAPDRLPVTIIDGQVLVVDGLQPLKMKWGGSVNVLNNNSLIGRRSNLNFIPGSNVTLNIADDSPNNRINITINSTGTGGGGSQTPWTQDINAANFSLNNARAIGIGAIADTGNPLKIITGAPGSPMSCQNTNPASTASMFFSNDANGNLMFGVGGSAFTSNPNRAFFNAFNDIDIAWLTNGIERMRVTAAGNVGIGVTNPQFIADIRRNTVGDVMYLGCPLLSDGDGPGLKFGNYTIGPHEARIKGVIDFAISSFGLSFWTSDIDGTGLAERMRIDGRGNVGIGNTAAVLPFSAAGFQHLVVGSAPGTNGGTLTLAVNGANIGILNFANYSRPGAEKRIAEIVCGIEDSVADSGFLAFHTWHLGTIQTPIWIKANGNVGIATATPESRFVVDSGSAEIRSGGHLILRRPDNGWDMRLAAVDTRLDILSGGAIGTPIATFVHGGNVGIGTVPNYRFHVEGGRSVFSAAGEGFALAVRYNGASPVVWLGADTVGTFMLSNAGGIGLMHLSQNGDFTQLRIGGVLRTLIVDGNGFVKAA